MSLLSELPMVTNKAAIPLQHPSASELPHKIGESIDQSWLRRLALEAGADDVGFVEINRPALEKDRPDIHNAFPLTKTLVSFVVRMNREPIRSPARSWPILSFIIRGTRSMLSLERLSNNSKLVEFEHSIQLWVSPWKWITFQERFGWSLIKRLQ